jgi:hypothetical protein
MVMGVVTTSASTGSCGPSATTLSLLQAAKTAARSSIAGKKLFLFMAIVCYGLVTVWVIVPDIVPDIVQFISYCAG